MFVCLCTGATSELVAEAVAKGAMTSKQIAAACGAGADCGRCRRTLRAIIATRCQAHTTLALPLAICC
jgi:bacterioferritin-associated ferredoxin